MYPGQGSNGMQPIMSSNSQPIVSGGEAVILAPNEKKPKRWPIIVIIVLVLIAIGTGIAALLLTRSSEAIGDEINSYIEYFVYGTEGGENQITNDTFNINPEDYALAQKMESYSAEESSEYFDKLYSKFSMMESAGKEKINAELLKNNGIYLEYYKAIMQSLYSDLLIKTYNNKVSLDDLYKNLNVGNNGTLEDALMVLKEYAKEQYQFYAQVEGWGCLDEDLVDYNCIIENEKESEILGGDKVKVEDLWKDNESIHDILAQNLSEFYKQGGKK